MEQSGWTAIQPGYGPLLLIKIEKYLQWSAEQSGAEGRVCGIWPFKNQGYFHCKERKHTSHPHLCIDYAKGWENISLLSCKKSILFLVIVTEMFNFDHPLSNCEILDGNMPFRGNK